MAGATLSDYERDAEHARAKLALDLSRLKRPGAASETAQHFIDQAGDKARSTASSLLEEVKAKAAANPIAALAIGAGIGWRLIRNPPITSALIGAGLVSLLRTPTPAAAAYDDFDPLETGVATLKSQVGNAARVAASHATEFGETVAGRMGDAATAATDAAQEKILAAAASVRAQAETVSHAALDGLTAAKRSLDKATAGVSDKAGAVYEAAAENVNRAQSELQNVAVVAREAVADNSLWRRASLMEDADRLVPDRLLLGVAGAAVLLVLGFAWQASSGRGAEKS